METNVLIIGAGMTGLSIAHGLEQAGIKYTIFDTEDGVRFRPKEWTMGIHWGLPLLESLLPPHLAKRIPTDGSVDGFLDYSQPPNNGAYIFDGVTGDILKDLTVNDRIVRVSRRKIRALCREDMEVKWSHTLESIRCNDDDNTVTARFTNGESYTGTLLVGCDGPRSTVRSHLFDEPAKAQAKTMEGCVNISMAISYPAETARYIRSKTHPVWCMAISPWIFPFMSMQDVPDPDKPETWKFFMMTNWLGEGELGLSNEDRLKALKERGAKLAEVRSHRVSYNGSRLIPTPQPFRTAVLEIPEDTSAPYVELVCWIAEPWNTLDGRVTLAGDAAHPMPPFRGQGGNHAVQDAYNFVEMVKKIVEAKDNRAELQKQLIREYSDEVAKRGAAETELSMKNGKFMMGYSEFKNSPYMKQGLNRG